MSQLYRVKSFAVKPLRIYFQRDLATIIENNCKRINRSFREKEWRKGMEKFSSLIDS